MTGEREERARYYAAQSEKVELQNAARRGELLEVADVTRGWSALVLAFRETMLTLAALCVQRGLVRREDEAAVQALIDAALRRLATGGARVPSR